MSIQKKSINNISISTCSFVLLKAMVDKGLDISTSITNLHIWTARKWVILNFGYYVDSYPCKLENGELLFTYTVSHLDKKGTFWMGLEYPEVEDPNNRPTFQSEEEALNIGLIEVLNNKV